MTATKEANEANGYFAWDGIDTSGEIKTRAKEFYDANGYVVLKNHAAEASTKALQDSAEEIIEAFRRDSKPAPTFKSGDKGRSGDDQFLSSASNITCFLEEEQENTSASQQSVNKIGHALHDLHETFRKFSYGPAVQSVAACMGLRNGVIAQSMYIVKGARVGGAVPPHRDATFVPSGTGRAGDCMAFWWALQRATLENGCLHVVPGSHVDGVRLRRFVRTEDDQVSFHGSPDCTYDDERYVPLPVEQGDVVLMHGAVVHRSERNFSEASRHAYSIHVVADGLAHGCWLRRSDDLPFRRMESIQV